MNWCEGDYFLGLGSRSNSRSNPASDTLLRRVLESSLSLHSHSFIFISSGIRPYGGVPSSPSGLKQLAIASCANLFLSFMKLSRSFMRFLSSLKFLNFLNKLPREFPLCSSLGITYGTWGVDFSLWLNVLR